MYVIVCPRHQKPEARAPGLINTWEDMDIAMVGWRNQRTARHDTKSIRGHRGRAETSGRFQGKRGDVRKMRSGMCRRTGTEEIEAAKGKLK